MGGLPGLGRTQLPSLGRFFPIRKLIHVKSLNDKLLRSCRNGDVAGAREVYLRLAREGLTPSLRVMDELLRLCSTSEGSEAVQQLSTLLEERGLRLERDLQLSCRAGHEDMAGAEHAFTQMAERGCVPVQSTTISLLAKCELFGTDQFTRNVVDFIMEKGLPVDVTMGSILLRIFSKKGQIRRAQELYSHLQVSEVQHSVCCCVRCSPEPPPPPPAG